MDALKPIIKRVLICAWALSWVVPASAQVASNGSLERLTPVEGRVADNEEQGWSFNAASGDVLSFFVKDISGGFDPVITLRNQAGEVVVSNDDYQYPTNGDALLEAITIPRTGTYTAAVSGFNGEAGAYRLTMLPGFSHVESSDNFEGTLTWEAVSEPLQVSSTDGHLGLSLEGMSLRGIAVEPRTNAPPNYFVQTNVNASGGADGWAVGFAARLQDADQYYALSVNSRGEWRFIRHEADGDQVVRDWTPHPAIVPGKATFTLGMMVNDIGYDFFYDGQLFGRLSDSSLPTDGGIGLTVETLGDPASQTTALFDNLVMTVPTLVNNQMLIPQQVARGTPGDMVQDLQRRSLIPGGGEMALTVNESFVESRRPGVERLMLGRGMTYLNFAIGTKVSWQAASPGMTGCGLVLRGVDDTNYTLAYIDQTGGYGLSQREGEQFQAGIFGEIANFPAGTHDLLVVARRDTLYYYVDGHYKGTLENRAIEGVVGNAVVNFDPISTSCTFSETWVWRWDEN